MANTEIYNLEFMTYVGSQNRVVIKPHIVEIAELKPGDKIKLALKEVIRQ
jgi:hypothetical protein